MQLRVEEDKKSVCFICGFPNYKFEHQAKVGHIFGLPTDITSTYTSAYLHHATQTS